MSTINSGKLADWRAAYARFWFDDLEPLGGRLRIIFYSVLLLLALTETFRCPLFAPVVFTMTDPDIYTPLGLVSVTGVSWASPSLLWAIRDCTLVAWVCAAIGLLSRWSLLFTGVGFFILHGITTGAVGVTHRWYMVMYSLLALSLAVRNTKWSVDYHLAKRFAWYPKPPTSGIGSTGFARKLILLFAVFTLFAGGVSKMLCSGPAWMDGRSLQYQISSTSNAHLTWLYEFLIHNLWACTLLSVATMVLELGAIFALFSRLARHIVVAGASLFHIGIFLVMDPVYWYQMWCYTLLVDWGRIEAHIKGRAYTSDESGAVDSAPTGNLVPEADSGAIGGSNSSDGRRTAPESIQPPRRGTSARNAALLAATCICTLLVFVMILQIEWWPLSHIPMYSEDASQYREKLRDEAQAVEFARVCHKHHAGNWPRNWYVISLIDKSGQPVPYEDFYKTDRSRAMHRKQMYRTIRWVVAADLVSKSPGPIAYNPDKPDFPATTWLRKVAAAFKRKVPDWSRYSKMVLVCNLESGPVVIASVELDEDKSQSKLAPAAR